MIQPRTQMQFSPISKFDSTPDPNAMMIWPGLRWYLAPDPNVIPPWIRMRFGSEPKITSVLDPVWDLVPEPNVIWSLTQIQFCLGPKCDLVLDPNEIPPSPRPKLHQISLWSCTQYGVWSHDSVLDPNHILSHIEVAPKIIPWVRQSHCILWSWNFNRWTGRLTADCSDIIP